MAITQTRMLELIRIAEDLKRKLLETRANIEELTKDLPAVPTIAQAMDTIKSLQFLAHHISVAPRDLEILATEKAHFKLNATRNAREAKRQRLRRGQNPESAPQPKSTAPASIHVKLSDTKYEYITRELAPPKQQAPMTNDALIAGIDETLAAQKLEINKFYREMGQPEPYADFLDESVPLTNEHRRHLGLPVEDDEGPF